MFEQRLFQRRLIIIILSLKVGRKVEIILN